MRMMTALIMLAAFIAVLGIDAFVIEPGMMEVSEIEVEGAGTDMRIGFIADMQRGDPDPAFVQRAADMMNGMDLDVILIGGDFVDKGAGELPSVEPLRGLKADHGVYAVLGNHDYGVYSFNRTPNLALGEIIIEYVESGGGIRVLRNEMVTINNVTIIGLDSYWAGLRDLEGARSGVQDGFRILISHNQNNLEISRDIADVYLFGHTHCGQVRLPFVGSVPKVLGFEGEYDYRHYTVNDVDVYTTCGLAPAPRFLNPPEITVISLVSADHT